MADATAFRFLDLPGEIQNMIYDYAVEPETSAESCSHHSCHVCHDSPCLHNCHLKPRYVPPLAQVCRKTRAEFLPVHHNATTWCICLGDVAHRHGEGKFLERVFNWNDKVPKSVTESWKGAIKVKVPFTNASAGSYLDDYKETEYLMTDFIKFMGNTPGINVEFVAPSSWEDRTSPVRDLQRLLDRSSPSFVDYVATAEGLSDVKFHLDFPTRWGTSDLECELIYERSKTPAWLRELVGGQFQSSSTTTVYPLEVILPYNAFLGIIRPGINNTFRVQTKERKRFEMGITRGVFIKERFVSLHFQWTRRG